MEEDFEEFKTDNIGDIEFNFDNLKKDGIGWLTRFLLRVWPAVGIKILARKLGFNSKEMEKADELFSGKKIDIVPLKGSTRGFQIILDNSTALYFYQDGDQFVYDGPEAGKYDKGDVTIFDDIKNKQ